MSGVTRKKSKLMNKTKTIGVIGWMGIVMLCGLAGNARAAIQTKFDYGCEPRSSWCSSLTVHFDARASTSTAGTITGYRWYFRRHLAEDNESQYGTATGALVTWTYHVVRCRSYTFYATLEVTDSAGNKATHTEKIDPSRRMDIPPENKRPVADFSVAKNYLECFFDAGASYDPDGDILGYAWDFGDGNTGTGETIHHTYAAAGDYTVRLTVTDNAGATTQKGLVLTVQDAPPPGFNLTAAGREARGGYHVVDLVWTGATTSAVDVYRNGVKIATVSNTGKYSDNTRVRGHGTYPYRVCEAGTGNCSNQATVVFD